MTRRIKMSMPADDGEKFTSVDALRMVGKETEFEGRTATVLQANVVKGGNAIHFTIETE